MNAYPSPDKMFIRLLHFLLAYLLMSSENYSFALEAPPHKLDKHVSSSLDSLGKEYMRQARYQNALYSFKQNLRELLKDKKVPPVDIALAHDQIGNVLSEMAQYYEAISYYEQALQIRQKTGKQSLLGITTSYTHIANALYRAGNYKKAIFYYQKSLDGLTTLPGKHQANRSVLYLHIAQSYQGIQQQQQEVTGLEHLPLAFSIENRNEFTEYQRKAWQYTKAFLSLRLTLLEEKDSSLRAYPLPLYVTPLFTRADTAYEALYLLEDLAYASSRFLGQSHPDIVFYYDQLGHYFRDQYHEYLASKLGGSEPFKLTFYGRPDKPGYSLFDTPERTQAIHFYQQAIQLRMQLYGKWHPQLAIGYENLGNFYVLTNACFEGRNLGTQSQINAKANEYAFYQTTLQKYYQQALDNYQKAIIADSYSEDSVDIEKKLRNISGTTQNVYAYILSPQLLLSILIHKAEAYRGLAMVPHTYIVSKHYLVGSDEKGNKETQELVSTDGGKENFEAMKASYHTLLTYESLANVLQVAYPVEQDKFLLAQQAKYVYLFAMDVCLELQSFDDNGGRIAEGIGTSKIKFVLKDTSSANYFAVKAFYFSEKSKASVLLSAIAGAQAKGNLLISPEVLDTEKALKNKVEQLRSQKVRADSLLYYTRKLEVLIQLVREKFPAYFEAIYHPSFVTLPMLQHDLDSSTAILSYSYFKQRLYRISITKKEIIIEVIKPSVLLDLQVGHKVAKVVKDKLKIEDKGGKITEKIKDFRASIVNYSPEKFTTLAYELSEILIPKLNTSITALIIIPDDMLSRVPFEILLTNKVSKSKVNIPQEFPYLLKKYTISYSYSTALLHINMAKKPASHAKGLIAFAPVFSSDKEAGLSSSNQLALLQLNQANRDSTSFRSILRDANRIQPIPASELEVKTLYDLFTKHNQPAQIYTHGKAKEELLKSNSISDYKYLHIATHGFLNASEPGLSGILLAQDSLSAEDGILYAGELYNLKLQADLVTLSACETGLGKIETGEGVIGLPRALLYAGAKNIVVSLWKVADQSTSDFMIAFYHAILSGHSYAIALRNAKLQLMASANYADPYYWSSFVLIGQ